MEPGEIEEIREHLLAWQEKLARQLPSLKEAAKPIFKGLAANLPIAWARLCRKS